MSNLIQNLRTSLFHPPDFGDVTEDIFACTALSNECSLRVKLKETKVTGERHRKSPKGEREGDAGGGRSHTQVQVSSRHTIFSLVQFPTAISPWRG